LATDFSIRRLAMDLRHRPPGGVLPLGVRPRLNVCAELIGPFVGHAGQMD
jgi:hypothetical protein